MKYFLISLCALLLAVGLIAGQTASAAYTPMAGDLIKTAKFSAVYIIDDSLKRHLFPNEATFFTWYSGGWSAQRITVVSQDDFDSFNSGVNVKARPGANLIMFDNSNKSYAVAPGGVLCETRALYGADWQTRVIKIQSSFENDYVKDSSCTVTSDGKLPNSSLIQYAKSTDIWYIDGGKKRRVSTDGFKANGFKDAAILKNVPTAMAYTAGTNINAFDYNLGILYSLNAVGTATSSMPDFVISDIIFPSSRIIVNSPIQIKLIIKNNGGNLTSDLGLNSIVFNGQDWTTTNISHVSYPSLTNPLKTGQTFEVDYTGKFVASGSKTFTAKANVPSVINEINSTNNSLSKNITVYTQ